MICPNCKCEYLAGITQCSDCSVPLVDALDSKTPSSPLEDGGIVSIWLGDDPQKFALVKEALEKAEIPCMGPGPSGSSIFPSIVPTLEICVSLADRDKAERVLLELGGAVDPDELTPDERKTLELPESEEVDHGVAARVASDLPEDWDDDAAVTEVWNGQQEDFADTLGACLRENGIASRRLIESGRLRLIVPTEHESRAKEIVREVVEASPPV